MFVVRTEQVEALRAAREPELRSRIRAHLAEHQPASIEGLSAAVLDARTRAALARARGYGLTWESSLAAFVALAFRVAPNFDEQPRIHATLSDPRFAPDDRLARLSQVTTDRDWRAASAAYDPSAWDDRTSR